MAKGRPMAALARSLSQGLARFQSKVASATASTTTRRATPPTIPIAIFLVRVMVTILGIAAGAMPILVYRPRVSRRAARVGLAGPIMCADLSAPA
ncbi:hypothetical protein D3C81_1927620 [compost metagenome]